MPVLEIILDPSSITASMLPLRFEVGPIGPIGFGGIPSASLDIGTGPFDFGIKVGYKCPGFPMCGKPGGACEFVTKSKIYRFSPDSLISFKMPGGALALPSIGPFHISVVVPPRPFRPYNCPNYRRRRSRE